MTEQHTPRRFQVDTAVEHGTLERQDWMQPGTAMVLASDYDTLKAELEKACEDLDAAKGREMAYRQEWLSVKAERDELREALRNACVVLRDAHRHESAAHFENIAKVPAQDARSVRP